MKGDGEAPPQDPPTLTNNEDEWEWRGGCLIPHHRQPRRKTFHPDWRLSELSHFEVEPYKAMYP
eukprot:10530263-Prorocentrum_lima.AAC.1